MGLESAVRIVDSLAQNVNNYIDDEFIAKQCRPYSAVHTAMSVGMVAKLNSIVPDYDTVDPEVDIYESTDEPDCPLKDKWSSSFINVEKVERLVVTDESEMNASDHSPKSHRSRTSSISYRSGFTRGRMPSLAFKKKMQFMQASENLKGIPKPLKVEKEAEDIIIKRLRERKEKQIQHQKWEIAEKKRLVEEEKKGKLKK